MSAVGIPSSGSIRNSWSRISPALPSYGTCPNGHPTAAQSRQKPLSATHREERLREKREVAILAALADRVVHRARSSKGDIRLGLFHTYAFNGIYGPQQGGIHASDFSSYIMKLLY
jgi:hypothetical protein